MSRITLVLSFGPANGESPRAEARTTDAVTGNVPLDLESCVIEGPPLPAPPEGPPQLITGELTRSWSISARSSFPLSSSCFLVVSPNGAYLALVFSKIGGQPLYRVPVVIDVHKAAAAVYMLVAAEAAPTSGFVEKAQKACSKSAHHSTDGGDLVATGLSAFHPPPSSCSGTLNRRKRY